MKMRIIAHMLCVTRSLEIQQSLLSCVSLRCVSILRILYDSEDFDGFFH